MIVEEMLSADYNLFVNELNKEIPLSTNYKVFNTVDDKYYKVICFYSKPHDIHPIAILKISNNGCEFTDEFPQLDSIVASKVLKSFLLNRESNSSLAI